MEKLRCNSPLLYFFIMLRHRAILYIVRTSGRRGLFLFLFLSFLFLTKYRSSHQWCTLEITRRLFNQEPEYLQEQRKVCTFLPWLWTLLFGLWLETVLCQRGGCTISPCRTILCHCVGREWAGGQAKGRKVSLKKKKRPCVRIHHHPTSVNEKHFFTVPQIKMFENTAGVPASLTTQRRPQWAFYLAL